MARNALGYEFGNPIRLSNLRRDSLEISVSAFHTVGRAFASRPGITENHHIMVHTVSLLGTHSVRSLPVQSDCLKGRVVCGTVYGDMHLKHRLRSIARVGYFVQVPDFYLELDGLRFLTSTIMDLPSASPYGWLNTENNQHKFNLLKFKKNL